jgi:stage V sporulation protein K
MIFKGNPGTGKTTVARILGKLFKEIGVLPKGHLVEVERADMVGEFIGHTAQKTREQIKKALGGILFIDEAYSLARGGEKDFGKEAIDALVKGMEDHRDNLVLILAGYQDEMDWFIESNPGLRSRFPVHLSFPDYSTSELLDIADLMLQKKQYELSGGAREELRFVIERELKCHENSGNARLVRNLIEKAIRKQAVRLLQDGKKITRRELMQLTREDLLGEANDV